MSASAASSFIGGIDAKICARSESPIHAISPERPLTHDEHQQSPNEIADADLTAAWHFGAAVGIPVNGVPWTGRQSS
jgi:hypothetical protein